MYHQVADLHFLTRGQTCLNPSPGPKPTIELDNFQSQLNMYYLQRQSVNFGEGTSPVFSLLQKLTLS